MDARTKVEALLALITGIDLNAVAETTLFVCPAGKSCIITKVILHNVAGAGLPLGTASISFGWNTAQADNVIANGVRAITDNTNYEIIPAKSEAVRGVAAGTFKIDVQTGEGAALTGDIAVFGYLY